MQRLHHALSDAEDDAGDHHGDEGWNHEGGVHIAEHVTEGEAA